jgi:hypothetical protein
LNDIVVGEIVKDAWGAFETTTFVHPPQLSPSFDSVIVPELAELVLSAQALTE